MNVELVFSEDTIICTLEPEVETRHGEITEIKNVKVNTQGSIEGIAVEVKIIGASKHQFCTIQGDEGKIFLILKILLPRNI